MQYKSGNALYSTEREQPIEQNLTLEEKDHKCQIREIQKKKFAFFLEGKTRVKVSIAKAVPLGFSGRC